MRHAGPGLTHRHVGAEGIGGLVMGLGAQIEVYEVAVCGSVGEGNGFRHRIAGHQIFEIAEQVGFRDPAYFCRVFRKETGKPPAEWRRAKRNETVPLSE